MGSVQGFRSRILLVATWLTIAGFALYLYFFRSGTVQHELETAFARSVVIASVIYLLLGTVRAFTLIPSTYLVLAGLPFFPPVLLFGLTLAGILISSGIIYRFAESLHLKKLFKSGRHKRQVDRLSTLLEKHELPIIIGWSFFPLAPTDLICYVCGVMDVNFPKFLLGILIGEGTICGLYIFLGDSALRVLHLR